MPVTWAPNSRAAWIPKLPQPEPMSSTPGALLEADLAADEVELGELGVLEGLGAVGEQRAGVGHRLIEEEREELVGDVVVVADGLGVELLGVALAGRLQLGGGRGRLGA